MDPGAGAVSTAAAAAAAADLNDAEAEEFAYKHDEAVEAAAMRATTFVSQDDEPRLRSVGAGMYWTASQRVFAINGKDGFESSEFVLTNGVVALANWSDSPLTPSPGGLDGFQTGGVELIERALGSIRETVFNHLLMSDEEQVQTMACLDQHGTLEQCWHGSLS